MRCSLLLPSDFSVIIILLPSSGPLQKLMMVFVEQCKIAKKTEYLAMCHLSVCMSFYCIFPIALDHFESSQQQFQVARVLVHDSLQ